MRVTGIVLAAGEGRRLGSKIPKAFAPIAGRPLVLRTLDRVFAAPLIDQVVLVVATADMERCEAMLRSDASLRDRLWILQSGGSTRQESAKRGLERVGTDTDIILIHDGARPFASVELIRRCVEAAITRGAAVPGLPAHDTIKMVSEDRWVQTTLKRESLWEIQTPQAFRRDLIIAAHEQAAREGLDLTDDALAVERYGEPVFVVEGERMNLKITVPEDVWLAELLIREGRVA